jgi:hypothetical protein
MKESNSYKGRYRVKNPIKYKGDHTNVIYRSSWELKCMNYFDLNENIESWSNEELIIPYVSPIDGKVHRYFPDFLVKFNKNGEVKTWLIEVKPKKYTIQPEMNPKKRTTAWVQKVVEWSKNQAKWEAARKYCDQQGWEFVIFTEDNIYGK